MVTTVIVGVLSLAILALLALFLYQRTLGAKA
jgi:hypothetical protein